MNSRVLRWTRIVYTTNIVCARLSVIGSLEGPLPFGGPFHDPGSTSVEVRRRRARRARILRPGRQRDAHWANMMKDRMHFTGKQEESRAKAQELHYLREFSEGATKANVFG